MNKTFRFLSLLAVLAIAFAEASPALAEEAQPPTPQRGPLHEYLVSAFAAAAGLTVEEVQDRLANGETLRQIAQAQGIDKTVMATVGSNALVAAVSAGAITQEQADRIASRERRRAAFGGPGPRKDALLEKLGLTREEMKALLDSGMSMQEIFAKQGVTMGPPRGAPRDLAEQCGISREEIRSRLQAGEKLRVICPGLTLPEGPPGGVPPNPPGGPGS